MTENQLREKSAASVPSSARWLGYAVALFVGIAFGAAGSSLAARSGSESPSTPAKDMGTRTTAKIQPTQAPTTKPAATKSPKPRRRNVQARSQNVAIEQLKALGYVDGSYDADSDLADVVIHNAKKANPGYNFYSSRRQTGARLIGMDGRELHSWRTNDKGKWQHASLLPNGDVIVIVKDRRLSRYDQNSNRLWSVKGRFHHDLWIHGDEIYVLARVARTVPAIHPSTPLLVDVIQVRSMDGALIRELSVLEAIQESPYAFLLPSIAHEKEAKKATRLDLLHTNHVEVFDGQLADRDPIYAKGHILISMRNINTIAILDGESLELLWVWGPTNLTFQHHPTLLDNGHILVFDNGVERSRILEIDPLSGEIVWNYSPKSGFFSKTRGSNQRLPNGNTLITESDRGYVLEVTPHGRTVWKFANPEVNRKKEREAIWRMTRIDPASLTFLN